MITLTKQNWWEELGEITDFEIQCALRGIVGAYLDNGVISPLISRNLFRKLPELVFEGKKMCYDFRADVSMRWMYNYDEISETSLPEWGHAFLIEQERKS